MLMQVLLPVEGSFALFHTVMTNHLSVKVCMTLFPPFKWDPEPGRGEEPSAPAIYTF